jgi:hypothetical protein
MARLLHYIISGMRAKALHSMILAIVAGAAAAGCGTYAHRAGEPVPGAPPATPAQVEMTAPMPGVNYTWIVGAWIWGPDQKWEWVKGHWEQPPFVGATWVPPRCENREGKYFYVPGKWE